MTWSKFQSNIDSLFLTTVDKIDLNQFHSQSESAHKWIQRERESGNTYFEFGLCIGR